MFEHHLTRGVAIGLFYFQDHDSGTGVTRDSATALQFFKHLEIPQEAIKSKTIQPFQAVFQLYTILHCPGLFNLFSGGPYKA